MSNKNINTQQGHWILAKMGKKVLRPGGKELTLKMIGNLNINSKDDVVEFAPGLGFTANITLKKIPKTYTGIELNEEAASILESTLKGNTVKIITASATESTLDSNAYTKVYGEAMLTMQADHRKSEIIKEAHRILKKGGRYGIHELALVPDEIPEDSKAFIQRELAQVIKVNARPLTAKEWVNLLETEGFKVINIETNPMHLLKPKRMVDDEGLLRTLKILFNILTHPRERKRIMAMRRIFKKYQQNLRGISIVIEKI